MATKKGPGRPKKDPAEKTVMLNASVPPRTRRIAEAIAEARGGLKLSTVVELAVEDLGRRVLGRRLADLVSPRRRTP